MKRGFLKNYRPQETDTSASPDVFKIPDIVPVLIDPDIPGIGRFPGGNTTVQAFKLPHDLYDHGDHDPTEPYAITLLYSGAKEALAATLGSPPPYTPSLRVHYRIDDAPGAGKGMFAVNDLDTGDIITRERPLCIFPKAIVGNPDEVYLKTLLKMKPEDVLDYFELTNCKTGCNAAWGILRTSGLSVGRTPGVYDGAYSCVCRDICRVNHSCSPNATYHWIFKDLMYELRAIRPIKAGEEISISYVNNLRSRSARQSHIESFYGFTCACSACSLPPSEIPRSDLRRTVVNSNRLNPNLFNDSTLAAWAENTRLPDDFISSQVMKFVGILKEEQLVQAEVCKMYYSQLTKIYCALKDEKKAKRWAKRTALLVTATNGDDMGWNRVADSPESTDWWGRKKRV